MYSHQSGGVTMSGSQRMAVIIGAASRETVHLSLQADMSCHWQRICAVIYYRAANCH
jgi:hypothetical protein